MDWADEKANELLPDLGDLSQNSLREDVAQALRDVQHETAEACTKVVRGYLGCDVIADAIRERFGLKEKS